MADSIEPKPDSADASAARPADMPGTDGGSVDATEKHAAIPGAKQPSGAVSMSSTSSDGPMSSNEPVSSDQPKSDDPLMSGDVAREVEEAMSHMSAEDLASLTADATGPTGVADGKGPADGDHRKGKIIGIYEDDVFIEIGERSQAVASRSSFGKEEVLEVGRVVDVVIERYDADAGLFIASRDGAVRKASWEALSVGSMVEGRITGMNKGGLEVNLNGIRAFMPASQVDIAHVKDISVFLGDKIVCEVVEMDRKRRSVLVSRRKAQEKQREEAREKLLVDLEVGQMREGKVTNLTDFGAFVDLGGVEGLVHISDLSYGNVEKVSDVVSTGDTVQVKVLKIDRDRDRISLGLKHAQPNPWDHVLDKYPVGEQVECRVLRLENFGAFVELEQGIEGLIPLSEMSWSRIKGPSEAVSVGQHVTAQVIRVEKGKRRIALSLKQIGTDPWAEVEQNFPKDSVIKGKVTRCAEFGAFVELVAGVEGLIHISELSDKHVKRCDEIVKPGDEVEVRVLSSDPEKRRLSLSMKTANEALAAQNAGDGQATDSRPKKKRTKPLRGGLSSHYDWQGQVIG